MKADTATGLFMKVHTGQRPVASGLGDLTAGCMKVDTSQHDKGNDFPLASHESKYPGSSHHGSKHVCGACMKVNTFGEISDRVTPEAWESGR